MHMSAKNYAMVSGVIFIALAVLHLLRVALGWEASIGGWDVPEWVSYAAIVVGGYLGYNGWKMGNR